MLWFYTSSGGDKPLFGIIDSLQHTKYKYNTRIGFQNTLLMATFYFFKRIKDANKVLKLFVVMTVKAGKEARINLKKNRHLPKDLFMTKILMYFSD